jgi:hypothetical protein
MWFGLGATMMLRTSGRAALFDLMLCGYQVNSSALFDLYLLVARALRSFAASLSILWKRTEWRGRGAKIAARLAGNTPAQVVMKIPRPLIDDSRAQACYP